MAKNDFRVTPIFKIIIRICMKNLSFYPKDVCLFIFCIFYLNENEFNQQVCLIKYVEKKIYRERETERQRQREKREERDFENISETLELVTNYYKL